jgi:hypothetical protein
MKRFAKQILATAVLTGVLVTGASAAYAHGTEAYGTDGKVYQEAPKDVNYFDSFKKMTIKQRIDFAKATLATAKYEDFNKAVADGYAQEGPFAGNDQGAMGIHFTRFDIAGDNVIDPAHPETLLYEPEADGSMKLVGIEYHVDAKLTDKAPEVFGQKFDGQMLNHHLDPSTLTVADLADKNNFHYDLHVWNFRHNPNGLFSIWNPTVHDNRTATTPAPHSTVSPSQER